MITGRNIPVKINDIPKAACIKTRLRVIAANLIPLLLLIALYNINIVNNSTAPAVILCVKCRATALLPRFGIICP